MYPAFLIIFLMCQFSTLSDKVNKISDSICNNDDKIIKDETDDKDLNSIENECEDESENPLNNIKFMIFIILLMILPLILIAAWEMLINNLREGVTQYGII